MKITLKINDKTIPEHFSAVTAAYNTPQAIESRHGLGKRFKESTQYVMETALETATNVADIALLLLIFGDDD